MYSGPPRQENIHEEEYVKNFREAILPAHKTSKHNLKSSHAFIKRDYDVRIRKVECKLGDEVYKSHTGYCLHYIIHCKKKIH